VKAAVLNAPKTPLSIEELTIDEPIAGEALVRVVAAGVCHSDLHFIEGTYPGRLPMVLGHEVAGVVEKVGPGVTHVKAGDRVIMGFVQPCGHCKYCDAGRPNLCQTRTTARAADRPILKRGDRRERHGKHRLRAVSVTPATGLVRCDGIGLDVAALVGCSVMTGTALW
jgi:Zn-dependent alcohol dehydrogenase